MGDVIPYVLFGCSLLLAIGTVSSVSRRFAFPGRILFIAFLPFLLIYLSALATLLSFFHFLNRDMFLLLQVLAGVVTSAHGRYTLPVFPRWREGGKKHWVLLLLILVILLVSALHRYLTPVVGFDDVMYRASTPMYWLQHQSVFPFETANERKSVFLYGSGLIYMWPFLFGLTESSALLFFWVAFPFSAVVLYVFSWEVLKHATGALLTTIIALSSPLIFYYFTFTVTQEVWLTPTMLCYGYLLWLLVHRRVDQTYAWLLGVGYIAMILIKPTAVIYGVSLLLLLDGSPQGWKQVARACGAAIGALICSGFVWIVILNGQRLGSPFGTPAFRQLHIASFTPQQIRVHTARFSLLFLDPPLFSTTLTGWWNHLAGVFADLSGATILLPGEKEEAWLSPFRYTTTWPNSKFSLAGICVFVLCCLLVRRSIIYKTLPEAQQRDILICGMFLFLLYVQVIYMKWAEGSMLPYRHLIAVVWFLLVLSSGMIATLQLHKKSFLVTFCTVLVTMTALITVLAMGKIEVQMWGKSPEEKWVDAGAMTSVEYETLQQMATPSTIVLVEDRDTRDYVYLLKQGVPFHRVLLMANKNNLSVRAFATQIATAVASEKADYLVIDRNQTEVIQELTRKNDAPLAFFGVGPHHTVLLTSGFSE